MTFVIRSMNSMKIVGKDNEKEENPVKYCTARACKLIR